MKTPEDRVKLRRDVSGRPDTNLLSDEAISRESIYSEGEEDGALAAELLALGRDCAAGLKEPWRNADHAELPYITRADCRNETIPGKTTMSVTIDLPPDIEARLAAQASELGVSLAQHLRHLLEEHAAPSKPAQKTPEERIRLWRDVSGVPETQPLSDEVISRESIYAERG